MRFILAALAVLVGFSVPLAAQDAPCGDADTPCRVDAGTYHMILPNGAPNGIVMHLHGAGATGKQMLNSGMARAAVARGYVFVAPDGFHPGMRFERNWSVRATNSSFEKDDAVLLRQ
ncbi:MAG: hypothetical protein AB3N09_06815, partial [Tateyamaria sp.]